MLSKQPAQNLCLTLVIVTALCTSLGGCALDQLVSRRLADALATQAIATEPDPQLAYEASAFYLKLSEAVLRQNPSHPALAESVASGFTQYAFAFVTQEADFLEDRDPRRASELRQRAAQLYQRAQQHAIKALQTQIPNIMLRLEHPESSSEGNPLTRAHVGLAYWAAAAWGGQISLSADSPEVVADFPKAIQLARWAWECDPNFALGGLASLMGTFEASRPGGSLAKAEAYFNQAIEVSDGNSAGAYLSKAERWAVPRQDRGQFESLISKALAVRTPDDHPFRLANQIMHARARWLAAKVNELF
jgi:hypothetical protein